MDDPVHYTSAEEDSARWLDFPFRDGDVVISTRSKSGTTWMQQICLSLALGSPELPDALSRLSPWLDWLVEPYDDVLARLERQDHRRVLKTHTTSTARASRSSQERRRLRRARRCSRLLRWIERDVDPRASLDSLPGVLWHPPRCD